MDISYLKNQDILLEPGVLIHYFLTNFNYSFQRSGRSLLKEYLNNFNECTKWMLLSDYVFNNKDKKDVITFSLVPYIVSFDEMDKLIKKLSSTDIKKAKSIDPTFINFLADGPIFNISIKLDKNRKLCSNERNFYIKKIDMLILQHEIWIEDAKKEGEKEWFKETIKCLKNFKSVINRTGTNLRVIRDIEIVSTLAAYFMSEVTTLANVEDIGWFSDRDTLLDFKSKEIGCIIIFKMVTIYYNTLCESQQIDSIGRIGFGIPESDQENSNKPWYDTLIRIPDLIAGTFADYDYKKDTVTHNKFLPIINHLFISEKRNLFYEINFSKKCKVKRVSFLPK